ncbi:MAG: hypothetical protein E7652_04190 [Ruminococcaceae bacterium]|nr:hypothetical protein [Oscillospiraceae bacterium]
MKFRDRLIRFMYGRNGYDTLAKVVLWIGVILSIINIFLHSWILSILIYLILFYTIFRAMSRNIWKRRLENEKFMKIWSKVTGVFKLQKNKFRDRKTHVYRQCPSCHANLRLPKQKGIHTVKCPRCSMRFETKGN